MTDAVVIERTLNASTEQVWEMWAEPKHFAAWYGPTGATVTVKNMDVTVGGTRHFSMEMSTPNGPMQMCFVGAFVEIDPPHRLVYTESMSDESGAVLAPAQMGMPADHPDTTEVTVELLAVDGGTKMTLTHAGIPADSPGAMGWNMALDKLTTYLQDGEHSA